MPYHWCLRALKHTTPAQKTTSAETSIKFLENGVTAKTDLTMALNACAVFSGPLFSSLYYQHVNSTCDQEGFLLGEISKRLVDVINDAQLACSKEEISINVTSILPCDEVYSFCDNTGAINGDRLVANLGNSLKKVIGWYRFRRDTQPEVMMMERVIHKNLCRLFNPQAQHFFLFGVFTCHTSSNLATYSYDHGFYRWNGRKFETLPMAVINLGDTGQSEYKQDSQLLMSSYLSILTDTVNKVNIQSDSSSVNLINGIQVSLQEKLETTFNQIENTELTLRDLTREVRLLKNQLHIRKSAAESPATPEQSWSPPTGPRKFSTQCTLPTSNKSPTERKQSPPATQKHTETKITSHTRPVPAYTSPSGGSSPKNLPRPPPHNVHKS